MERRRRRTFWEATIGICALMASFGGTVSLSDRVRVDRILDELPESDLFNASESVALFDALVEEFQTSPGSARARAIEAARNAAENEEEARFFVQIAELLIDPASAGYGEQVRMLDALRVALELEAGSRPTRARGAAVAVAVAPDGNRSVVESARAATGSTVDRDAARRDQGAATASAADAPPAESAPETTRSTMAVASRERKKGMADSGSVFVLFGRGKAGTVDALRAYSDRSHAEADQALAAKLARNDCTIASVQLFVSGTRDALSPNADPKLHILCHERSGGGTDGLRAFVGARRAGLDLGFVESISSDKFWVSSVDLIGD